jgi:hypothetical protein
MSVKHKLIPFAVLAPLALAAAQALADPMQAVLDESKASGKGLTFYVAGQAIPGVVVSADDKVVVARSTASGTIVIRRERLDAVAGHVTPPGERK